VYKAHGIVLSLSFALFSLLLFCHFLLLLPSPRILLDPPNELKTNRKRLQTSEGATDFRGSFLKFEWRSRRGLERDYGVASEMLPMMMVLPTTSCATAG
jgi:hypothetical protein